MINSDIKSYIDNAFKKLESQLSTFKIEKENNKLSFLSDDCDEYIKLIEKVIDAIDDQSTQDIADLTQLKSDFQSKNQEIKEAKNQVELFKEIEKSALALTTNAEEIKGESDVNNLLKNLYKFVNISSVQPAFERTLNARRMYNGISQLNEDEQNKIVLDDKVLSCLIDLKEDVPTQSVTDYMLVLFFLLLFQPEFLKSLFLKNLS